MKLPPKTQNIIERYLNIKFGEETVVCPYYQNLRKKTKPPVFSGKGNPKEIETEIEKILKIKPEIIKYSYDSKRLALVEANLGIDCSGLVVNILNKFLKETMNKSLFSIIPRNAFSFRRQLSFILRPRTNLSAHDLSSPPISKKIDIKKIKPGDLFKVGKGHIAIVSQVWKTKKQLKKFTYIHSTPDYGIKYGVKKGQIIIKDIKKPLKNQKWTETLNNQNWIKKDYIKAPKTKRGFYRLNALCKK